MGILQEYRWIQLFCKISWCIESTSPFFQWIKKNFDKEFLIKEEEDPEALKKWNEKKSTKFIDKINKYISYIIYHREVESPEQGYRKGSIRLGLI